MSDEKKDLTGIIEYSQNLKDKGELPAAPNSGGVVMEESPFEKIDEFESLADYSANNPVTAAPPPEENIFETTEPSEPAMSFEDNSNNSDFQTTPETNPTDFGETGDFNQPDFNQGFEATPSEGEASSTPEPFFNNSDFSANSSDSSNSLESDFQTTNSQEFSTSDFSATEEAAPNDFSPPEEFSSPAETPASAIAAPPPPPPTPPVPSSAHTPSSPPPTTLKSAKTTTPVDEIKNYQKNVSVAKSAVPAAFPFSLMIHGKLTDEEKEKLLDIISREKMGIREIDLEPQLASGRILIPRISEYAGILLVQALRGVNAQMKLGPADTIFASSESKEESKENNSVPEDNTTTVQSDFGHPAESLPITIDGILPDLPQGHRLSVIDTLTVSAALKSNVVEAENSTEYHELLEALQRELKYRAYRKGASAIIHFKVQMNFLTSPTHYRVLAMGTAVKIVDATPVASPPNPTSVQPN